MMTMASMIGKDRLARGLWWTRAWSLIEGCSPISPACLHCWAAEAAHMRAENPNEKVRAANAGLTSTKEADGWIGAAPPHFNGEVRTRPDLLDGKGSPLRTRKPAVWSVWTDLWHDAVGGEFIRDCIEVMREADWHIFVACTKRAERMCRLATEWAKQGIALPKNMIAMVTAENQEQADTRIPWLLKTPAACRAVAIEPVLGPVDLGIVQQWELSAMKGEIHKPALNWVTLGQETGRHARPADIAWFRKVRDDCHQAGVPLFVKRSPHGLSIIDGVEHQGLPEVMA